MPKTKITDEQAEMIKLFAETGLKAPELAREYGCTPDNINLILNGVTHKGYNRPRSDRRLDDAAVRNVKIFMKQGYTDSKISKITGIARGTLYQIRTGKSYRS